MFIDGIGIKGYRSFGGEVQKIGPFSKINLFVGQNNAGKSNILRLIDEKYAMFFEGTKSARKPLSFKESEFPMGPWDGVIEVLFGFKEGGKSYKNLVSAKEKIDSSYLGARAKEAFDSFISALTENGVIWAPYEASRNSLTLSQNTGSTIQVLRELKIDDHSLSKVWTALTNHTGGGKNDWLSGIATILRPYTYDSDNPPLVSVIPAVRQVVIGNSANQSDFSGTSINDRLAQLENPPTGADRQEKRNKFDGIIEFLRSVTGSTNATITIPYGHKEIIVRMDGRELPLDALGTGIHQVVILAAAATTITNQVVCIEEPEVHLHPILQRKLLRYLHENTDNQYFITTHSAHLLDMKEASIFHVQLVDGYSKVDLVTTSVQRTVICADLGYRASDLLQANAIIWVEGPSDRLYLRHWIKQIDHTLIEGVHYSIMFYGGRLLSHLSANDPEIDDFISLRRLNRYIAIVIDSDRKESTDEMNDTKKRIQEEFDEGHGFAWVTEGREIENYFEGDEMEAIVKSVHPSASHLVGKGLLEQQSHYINNDDKKVEMDKVKVAHKVIETTDMKPKLDFDSRIKQMVEFIQQANNE